MIYRFRVVLDAEEDIFRDIELENESTFEDFHNTIIQSFGLSGHEMATFYLTDDDWNQGEAISQTDMFDEPNRLMEETKLSDVINEEQQTALYIYDFLEMWTFFVTCVEEAEVVSGLSYPNLVFSHGVLPAEAPPKQFKGSSGSEEEEDGEEEEDDWDDDAFY
jgi:hypothetical protein